MRQRHERVPYSFTCRPHHSVAPRDGHWPVGQVEYDYEHEMLPCPQRKVRAIGRPAKTAGTPLAKGEGAVAKNAPTLSISSTRPKYYVRDEVRSVVQEVLIF